VRYLTEKKVSLFLIRINANCRARNSTAVNPLSPRSRSGKNENKEVTMTTVASIRNFECETTCAKCGNALIAPEWSEYVSERLVLNLWSCTKCGCQFETKAYMPADAESMNDRMAVEAFFPSLSRKNNWRSQQGSNLGPAS
jgi:ribosomal protein L37AE/L43A